MHGYLRMRIAQFLSVVHPHRHTIYLSRHGQSEYNVLGKIGGNPPLSPLGRSRDSSLACALLPSCALLTSAHFLVLPRALLTPASSPVQARSTRSGSASGCRERCT